jgi:opacity protein-like surface antigen
MRYSMMAAAILAAAMVIGTQADAQPYVKVLGGLTFDDVSTNSDGDEFDIDTDTGYNFGIAFGVPFANAPNVSIEGDVFFTDATLSDVSDELEDSDLVITDASAQTLSLMANIIYRMGANLPFGLYVGAGAGGIQKSLALDGLDASISNWNFGGQLLAGIEFPLTNAVMLVAQYRWQFSQEWELDFGDIGTGNIDLQSHNFSVGVKIPL